jgi:murein DD-endopeptidase MepM/ murein hydrolase activator NlpD
MAGLILGVAWLWHADLGEEAITEDRETWRRTQANLDAVLGEIEELAPVARTIDAEIEPLFELLAPSDDLRDSVPGSLPFLQDRTFFGATVGDNDLLPTYVEHLTQELSQTTALLSSARNSQEMVSRVLRDIPNAWPVGGNGGNVSMEFGPNIHPITGQWYLHKGLDIAGTPGTPIIATADGEVTLAGYDPGYGFQVVLRHDFGFSTRYPHMREIAVSEGQEIVQGQVVGYMGRSGIVTGTHLHFEVMLGPEILDPAPFLLISNSFRRGGYGTR